MSDLTRLGKVLDSTHFLPNSGTDRRFEWEAVINGLERGKLGNNMPKERICGIFNAIYLRNEVFLRIASRDQSNLCL